MHYWNVWQVTLIIWLKVYSAFFQKNASKSNFAAKIQVGALSKCRAGKNTPLNIIFKGLTISILSFIFLKKKIVKNCCGACADHFADHFQSSNAKEF